MTQGFPGAHYKRPRIALLRAEEGWFTVVTFPRGMQAFGSRAAALEHLSTAVNQFFDGKVDVHDVDLTTGSREELLGGLAHLRAISRPQKLAVKKAPSKKTAKRRRKG